MAMSLLRLPLFCLALAAVLVLGCDGGDNDSAAGGAGSGGKTFTIGMSQANLAEPYRAQMNADIEQAAAKHPGVRVVFKDAQKDSLKQRAHVEEFISQGVDLILISPNEPAPLKEPVERAMEAGIPVIVIDRRLPEGTRFTTFIGADNYQIGRGAGEWIKRVLGGRGSVVELQGMMSTDPAQQRHKGFRDAIAGSEIQVVFLADMKWDQSQAKAEMESALARAVEIDLVYAHNDPGAYGAYLAAQQAGRAGGMKFVGIDALPNEGVAYVQQGILDASFQYPTCGAEAIETAVRILSGEAVAREITLESAFFTKENVAAGGEPLSAISGAAGPATRPTS